METNYKDLALKTRVLTPKPTDFQNQIEDIVTNGLGYDSRTIYNKNEDPFFVKFFKNDEIKNTDKGLEIHLFNILKPLAKEVVEVETISSLSLEECFFNLYDEVVNRHPFIYLEIGYNRQTDWMLQLWNKAGGMERKICIIEEISKEDLFRKGIVERNVSAIPFFRGGLANPLLRQTVLIR